MGDCELVVGGPERLFHQVETEGGLPVMVENENVEV